MSPIIWIKFSKNYFCRALRVFNNFPLNLEEGAGEPPQQSSSGEKQCNARREAKISNDCCLAARVSGKESLLRNNGLLMPDGNHLYLIFHTGCILRIEYVRLNEGSFDGWEG